MRDSGDRWFESNRACQTKSALQGGWNGSRKVSRFLSYAVCIRAAYGLTLRYLAGPLVRNRRRSRDEGPVTLDLQASAIDCPDRDKPRIKAHAYLITVITD
jgi:hypothetical protein